MLGITHATTELTAKPQGVSNVRADKKVAVSVDARSVDKSAKKGMSLGLG